MSNKNNEQDTSYQKKSAKVEDVKSSAITLFIVGTAGLIVVLLCIFDVLPIHFTLSGKIISCGMMAVLFLTMIIFGFVSMKSVKGLVWLANEEDKLTAEIESWYRENLTAEVIDQGLFDEEEAKGPEELKYFKRNAKIKFLLAHKFMNLGNDYLENMAEKIYQEIFDEN